MCRVYYAGPGFCGSAFDLFLDGQSQIRNLPLGLIRTPFFLVSPDPVNLNLNSLNLNIDPVDFRFRSGSGQSSSGFGQSQS